MPFYVKEKPTVVFSFFDFMFFLFFWFGQQREEDFQKIIVTNE